MKGKRGSHVGVILSFAIFITFVVFLYFVMEPTLRIQEEKETLLDNLKIRFLEKISGNYSVLTIKIDNDVSNPCVRFRDLIGGSVTNYTLDLHIVVKNESGGIPSQVSINNQDLYVERSDASNVFFKIYHSEEFPAVASGPIAPCPGRLDPEDYTIEAVSLRTEIFKTIINKTLIQYNSDYTKLKEELKIPGGSEFGFRFTDKSSFMIQTKEKNVSRSVYVEEIPVLYSDDIANINSGFLDLRVW